MAYGDPIEPPEPCPCGSPLCTCGKCHGVGWVWVGPRYPVEQVPDPAESLLAQIPAEAHAMHARQVDLQRRAAALSVYPCRACNSALFYRWREGHLASDHDRGSCPECQGQGVAPRRRRVSA